MKPRFRLDLTLEEAADSITAAYAAEVEFRGCTFLPDEPTKQHILECAVWLTKEKPKFGMLLCGPCGNGKSTLVRALRSLVAFLYSYREQSHAIHLCDAKEIVALAKSDYLAFKKVCNCDMLAIDDLGIEPAEVLDYGNILNPAIDLLSHRYNEQLFTIVTTNLSPAQIREHYGDRIADRFNEMMERIVFKNPTYRGG